ncbi:EMB2654, partial [Symbiodinium microadriaticum]
GAAWQAALLVVDAMEEAAVQKDIITYNSAIGASGKGGRWEVAVHLLTEAAMSSIEHDRVSYYTAIQACETCGEWSRALLLLQSLLMSGVRDHLGADSLDRHTYVHAFQAGDPIDCFKHVVYLSLSQALMASEEPLTIVDCHAGSGIYDFRGLAPGFHRNFEDGIFQLVSVGVPAACDAVTPAVCQYLEIQRRINRKASPGGRREFDLFAGSAVLAAQVRRFQDR